MCPRVKGFVQWGHCQNLLDDPRMLILNVIDNGLACDCGDCRVFIMKCHRFCKKFIP